MVNVIIGLAGLGLVVFLHELGHLLAAKSVGVTVEAFSVGWGRKIWSTTRGGTEYRVSWLPIGGYCKMKGEHALLKAWQTRSATIETEDGDFYAARPMQRIFILIAGPAINLLFAILVLTAIAFIGYSIQTFPNRIVLAEEYGATGTAAAQAGLKSGDFITGIDGAAVATFRDIQAEIGQAARQELTITVERDGQSMELTLIPALDTATGAGRIGVYPWISPVVAEVENGSAAALGGILPGDRITAIAGSPVEHSVAVEIALSAAGAAPVAVTVLRESESRTVTVIPDQDETGNPVLGVRYQTLTVTSEQFGMFAALGEGVRQSYETLRLTLRGIALLFGGVDLNQALMGPVRITYMVGEVATAGMQGGIGRALLSFFNFLSLISITLFFMNLLPIPVLDGGQIVLSATELLRQRPLHPRFVYHYQMVGNVIIIVLMFFAFFNDILFFARG